MLKILVLGDSGFVGKNLIEKLLLKKKFLIYKAIFSKKKFLYIHQIVKVNNKKNEHIINFKNIKYIDCIVNCIAKLPAFKKKNNSLAEYRRINVEQTLIFAKQALKNRVKRFINISSILVQDISIKKKIKDSRDYYRISKLECEIELMKFSKKTKLEVVILRPPLIYGKYVKGNFLSLLNLIYKRIPLPLRSIRFARSYCGVDNLIDLIIVCFNHPKAPGKIFCVSDNENISISDLVKKISNYMQKSLILYSFPEPFLRFICRFILKNKAFENIVESLNVDISNTYKVLNWTPKFSLDYNIKKTVDWYLKNK